MQVLRLVSLFCLLYDLYLIALSFYTSIKARNNFYSLFMNFYVFLCYTVYIFIIIAFTPVNNRKNSPQLPMSSFYVRIIMYTHVGIRSNLAQVGWFIFFYGSTIFQFHAKSATCYVSGHIFNRADAEQIENSYKSI